MVRGSLFASGTVLSWLETAQNHYFRGRFEEGFRKRFTEGFGEALKKGSWTDSVIGGNLDFGLGE